jgi:hypothetical protein
MPEFCTCGAQLPPDALFCHKCGKPQREIVVEAPEPPPDTPALNPALSAPAEEAPAPGFRNPVALRVALLVAVAATLFGWLLPFFNWLLAGFLAVFFYRKKSRGQLNLSAGLRLGWITGVIMFGLWSIVFGALTAMGQLGKLFEEQLRNLPANDPSVQQFVRLLESGPGIVLMLAFGFIFIISLSMAGGALGAKLVGRSE